MRSLRLLSTFLLCLFIACTNDSTSDQSDGLSGKVVSIADGDTFTLLTNDKQQVKVRLHGIDCPERAQDFGQVARQKLSDMVFNQQVRIVEKDIDRYKRTVAIVYTADNTCVNEELLRTGLAWHYTQYDDNPQWAALEKDARRRHIGLWSQPDAIPPSEYRSSKRTKVAQ